MGTFALTIAGLEEGEHTLTASAGDISTSSSFIVEFATEADDDDGNALLDDPFTRLPDGGVWISSVAIETTVDGETVVKTLVAGMVRWGSGTKQDASEPISLSLSNAEETARVTVVVPRNLLADNENGLLIVELAPDLSTLLAQSAAADLDVMAAGQPATALSEYVEVTVVVESDSGLQELGDFSGDILVILEGVDTSTTASVEFWTHDTVVDDDPTSGLQIVAGAGGWESVGGSLSGTTIAVGVTNLSSFAVFKKQASEGEGEGVVDGNGSGGGGCGAVAQRTVGAQARLADVLLLALMAAGLIVSGRGRRVDAKSMICGKTRGIEAASPFN